MDLDYVHVYIAGGGVNKTISIYEKDEKREEPIMLGRQNHLWVRRQLPRSWSRTITILMVMVAVKADFNLACQTLFT